MFGQETITERVRPLTGQQIQEHHSFVLDSLSRLTPYGIFHLGGIFDDIRNRNLGFMDKRPVLWIPAFAGYLGELVRASHWIPLVREWSGQEPFVVTPHPEIFAGKKVVEKLNGEDNFLDVYSLTVGNMQMMDSPERYWRLISSEYSYQNGRLIRHLLHTLQITAYALFGKIVETFPRAEISFSPSAHQTAQRLIESLDIGSSQVPLLVYPDASVLMLGRKRWEDESYDQVLTSLQRDFGEKIRVVILTGVDHLGESMRLSDRLGAKVRHVMIPQIPDLGVFGAFMEGLAQKGAVMFGTDSFVPGHLFPVVGGQSVVIGWDRDHVGRGHNYYCPVERGCATLESRNHGFPSPKQVSKALALRIRAHSEH